MSIRLTLSAFRVIRRPFSQPHPKRNHPQLPDQPRPSCRRHNRVVQNPSDGPGISRTTTAWYGTPSKPLNGIPYRTTPTLRQQKPRNSNTHPKPNGPWYGTERPKPRFQHSVPQLRGTEPTKAPQRASVPYHTPRFIVVKRSSRVCVLYTCPAVPLMRHTPCINYMLRKFVVIRGCGRFLGDRTERFSYVQS